MICRAIRAIAFLALEAIKIFVRIPMIVLDAANAVLDVAQFVVDKARIVLYVAEGILEVAKLGLEAVKGGLEIAKGVIEVVKFIVKAALYVFEMFVQGIQNLIDVKNCKFEIQLSAKDKTLFEVGCEVNAFNLGWKSFHFWFDFNYPVTSILRIAKATVNRLLDFVTDIFDKRKKRELS